MKLNLKYEAIAENAARFAEDIVKSTKDITVAHLDYSSASLAIVDQVVGRFARDGCKVDDVKETLFGFGCYVGEVFVRAGHGFSCAENVWEVEVLGFPLVVEQGPDKTLQPDREGVSAS